MMLRRRQRWVTKLLVGTPRTEKIRQQLCTQGRKIKDNAWRSHICIRTTTKFNKIKTICLRVVKMTMQLMIEARITSMKGALNIKWNKTICKNQGTRIPRWAHRRMEWYHHQTSSYRSTTTISAVTRGESFFFYSREVMDRESRDERCKVDRALECCSKPFIQTCNRSRECLTCKRKAKNNCGIIDSCEKRKTDTMQKIHRGTVPTGKNGTKVMVSNSCNEEETNGWLYIKVWYGYGE